MFGLHNLLNDGFRPGFVFSLDFKGVDHFLVGSPLFLLVPFSIPVSYVVLLTDFVEFIDSLVSSSQSFIQFRKWATIVVFTIHWIPKVPFSRFKLALNKTVKIKTTTRLRYNRIFFCNNMVARCSPLFPLGVTFRLFSGHDIGTLMSWAFLNQVCHQQNVASF